MIVWLTCSSTLMKFFNHHSMLMTTVPFLLTHLFKTEKLANRFDSLKKVRNAWDLSRIETILLEAAAELPVEQCCLSYLFLENFSTALSKLHKDDQPDSVYLELVSKLQQAVRSRLILRVAMATKCNAWKSLPNEMQTNIMQLGFFNPLETRKAKTELGVPRSQVKVTRCQSMLSHSATNSRDHQRTTNLTRTGSSLHPRATTIQNQTSQVNHHQIPKSICYCY